VRDRRACWRTRPKAVITFGDEIKKPPTPAGAPWNSHTLSGVGDITVTTLGGVMVGAGQLDLCVDGIKSTVLIVDDEVLVRAMVADPLRDDGFRVVEAINADEALAILRSATRVDLVLTDMRMPGTMDGAGLVHLIRTEFPSIKVILMSSESPDDSLLPALDHYVSKPFTYYSQLRSRVLALTGVTPVDDDRV
jgi:CheY-like chemotaxis protein